MNPTATFWPVLWTDFNFPERPILALRGCWALVAGREVVLDDDEGTKVRGTVIGPPDATDWHRPEAADKYVLVAFDPKLIEHYEL